MQCAFYFHFQFTLCVEFDWQAMTNHNPPFLSEKVVRRVSRLTSVDLDNSVSSRVKTFLMFIHVIHDAINQRSGTYGSRATSGSLAKIMWLARSLTLYQQTIDEKQLKHINRDRLSAEKATNYNSLVVVQPTEVNEKFMIIIILKLYRQKCVFSAVRECHESPQQSTNRLRFCGNLQLLHWDSSWRKPF